MSALQSYYEREREREGDDVYIEMYREIYIYYTYIICITPDTWLALKMVIIVINTFINYYKSYQQKFGFSFRGLISL